MKPGYKNKQFSPTVLAVNLPWLLLATGWGEIGARTVQKSAWGNLEKLSQTLLDLVLLLWVLYLGKVSNS